MTIALVFITYSDGNSLCWSQKAMMSPRRMRSAAWAFVTLLVFMEASSMVAGRRLLDSTMHPSYTDHHYKPIDLSNPMKFRVSHTGSSYSAVSGNTYTITWNYNYTYEPLTIQAGQTVCVCPDVFLCRWRRDWECSILFVGDLDLERCHTT